MSGFGGFRFSVLSLGWDLVFRGLRFWGLGFSGSQTPRPLNQKNLVHSMSGADLTH